MIKCCVVCGEKFSGRKTDLTCSKPCSIKKGKDRSKEWKKANKDKCSGYHHYWYQQNRDKITERNKNNREHRAAIGKAWYQRNIHHAKEKNKLWREKNREKLKENYINKKAAIEYVRNLERQLKEIGVEVHATEQSKSICRIPKRNASKSERITEGCV